MLSYLLYYLYTIFTVSTLWCGIILATNSKPHLSELGLLGTWNLRSTADKALLHQPCSHSGNLWHFDIINIILSVLLYGSGTWPLNDLFARIDRFDSRALKTIENRWYQHIFNEVLRACMHEHAASHLQYTMVHPLVWPCPPPQRCVTVKSQFSLNNTLLIPL